MRKAFTILLSLTAFSANICSGQNNNNNVDTSCLVKQINIGTGIDHLSEGVLYPYSQDDLSIKDRYWRLTMLPENSMLSTPACAQVLDSAHVAADVWWDWIDMSTSVESRAIGYTSRPTDEGLYPNAGDFWAVYLWPPEYVDSPARFTRTFKIVADAPQAVTFTMEGKADDIVFIRVDAEPGIAIFDDSTNINNLRYDTETNTSATPFLIEKTLTLEPGIHTIDMDLYDAGGICSGLNVKGTISCANKVIEDNVCFGYADEETCSIITDSSITGLSRVPGEKVKMEIFPNPVIDIFHIQSSYIGNYKLIIRNSLGQVVSTEGGFMSVLAGFNISHLSPGSYFVEFITDKGIAVSKIVRR